jgi:DNA-binding NarL/FixJ family response regulator
MAKILVATIAADPTFKRGLGWLLREIKSVEVIKEAFEVNEIIILEKQPKVVIIDTGKSIAEGILNSRLILENLPDSKIILLTYFDGTAYLEMIISAGIHCLLKKPFSLKTLSDAVSQVSSEDGFSNENTLQTFYKNQ